MAARTAFASSARIPTGNDASKLRAPHLRPAIPAYRPLEDGQYTGGPMRIFRYGCGSMRRMEERMMAKKVAMVLANNFEETAPRMMPWQRERLGV